MRALLCFLGVAVLHAHLARTQPSLGRPSFEVASITASPGCELRPIDRSPGRVRIECVTVERLIRYAYIQYADGRQLNPSQTEVSGGPEWIRSDRFDVEGKAEGPAPLAEMLGPMMQVLLEQRFGLKLRHETKELPVYVLTLSKGGATKWKPSECITPDPNRTMAPPPIVPGQPVPRICGNVRLRPGATSDTFDGDGLTMAEFSLVLSRQLGRKTVDRTGISGKYDLHLEFLPDDDGGFGSALVASIDQLGLKLSTEKGTAEYIVVDSVQKPAAN
jgi:uncharacterized protein (TIGR03435 family)